VLDASKLNIGAACCNRSNSRGHDIHPACGPRGDLVSCGRPALLWELGVKRDWLRADSYLCWAWLSRHVGRFE
jgi:hypothetical protein